MLLFVVFLLPIAPMETNVRESIDELQAESAIGSEYFYGYQMSYNGNFTDAIMLQEAIYDSDHSTLEEAMMIYRQEDVVEAWSPVNSLYGYLLRVGSNEVSYARYWHGYLVLLKPLLMILNFSELKMMNLILFMMLSCAVILQLVQMGHRSAVQALIVMLIFMTPISMIYTLSQAVCGLLMLGASLWILAKRDLVQRDAHGIYSFLVFGICTAYFDFLTYPLVTLGVPLIFWLMESDPAKRIGRVIRASIAWAFGYLGMWSLKWVIGSILLQENLFADAFETIRVRTGASEQGSLLSRFVQTVILNFKEYQGMTYRLFLLAVICWMVSRVVRSILARKRDLDFFDAMDAEEGMKENRQQYMMKMGIYPKRTILQIISSYCLVAVMPFAWFLVTTNHSYEHPYLAFRILGITQLALMVLVLEATRSRKECV